MNSLYWAITSMATVGYGDITPKTTKERISVIILMFIAAGVYALIINDISKIVNNFNVLAN